MGLLLVDQPWFQESLINRMMEGVNGFFNLSDVEKREFQGKHLFDRISHTAFEYSKLMREIISDLLKVVSESLGLEPNYINKAMNMDSNFQVFIANLYPPCPEPKHALGLLPHYDHGLLTIVAENISGGLQTLPNGKWVKVNVPPNALMVNTGDPLEVCFVKILTNGKYKSNVHRSALFCNATRISMVTIDGPLLDQLIRPAPELVDETHPSAYTSIT